MENGAGVGETRSGKAPVSWQTVNGVDKNLDFHVKFQYQHLSQLQLSLLFILAQKHSSTLALTSGSLETFCDVFSNWLSTPPAPSLPSRKASGEIW